MKVVTAAASCHPLQLKIQLKISQSGGHYRCSLHTTPIWYGPICLVWSGTVQSVHPIHPVAIQFLPFYQPEHKKRISLEKTERNDTMINIPIASSQESMAPITIQHPCTTSTFVLPLYDPPYPLKGTPKSLP